MSSEPQPTVAWAQGARGERLLGEYLETLHDGETVIVLHDRHTPGSRANVDHIAVTRSGGVWAIDAKNYTGKVQRIDKGGWLSTDERLYVGRRDCSKLVAGMARQVDPIKRAIGEPVMQELDVTVRAALCFVDAEWSLFAKPFALDGVWIGWAKALGAPLQAEGALAPEHVRLLARRVADALPPA
ncbi:MAG TPA: nuclease-related domain-containing protein [Gaiellaceae bacterium]|nr:nuclease-related domain-containing protein [Gaiellaceae bacterium]